MKKKARSLLSILDFFFYVYDAERHGMHAFIYVVRNTVNYYAKIMLIM